VAIAACAGRPTDQAASVHPGRDPPAELVVFGTWLDAPPANYERYLVNSLREKLGFGSVPIRLSLRAAKNPFAKQD